MKRVVAAVTLIVLGGAAWLGWSDAPPPSYLSAFVPWRAKKVAARIATAGANALAGAATASHARKLSPSDQEIAAWTAASPAPSAAAYFDELFKEAETKLNPEVVSGELARKIARYLAYAPLRMPPLSAEAALRAPELALAEKDARALEADADVALATVELALRALEGSALREKDTLWALVERHASIRELPAKMGEQLRVSALADLIAHQEQVLEGADYRVLASRFSLVEKDPKLRADAFNQLAGSRPSSDASAYLLSCADLDTRIAANNRLSPR